MPQHEVCLPAARHIGDHAKGARLVSFGLIGPPKRRIRLLDAGAPPLRERLPVTVLVHRVAILDRAGVYPRVRIVAVVPAHRCVSVAIAVGIRGRRRGVPGFVRVLGCVAGFIRVGRGVRGDQAHGALLGPLALGDDDERHAARGAVIGAEGEAVEHHLLPRPEVQEHWSVRGGNTRAGEQIRGRGGEHLEIAPRADPQRDQVVATVAVEVFATEGREPSVVRPAEPVSVEVTEGFGPAFEPVAVLRATRPGEDRVYVPQGPLGFRAGAVARAQGP